MDTQMCSILRSFLRLLSFLVNTCKQDGVKALFADCCAVDYTGSDPFALCSELVLRPHCPVPPLFVTFGVSWIQAISHMHGCTHFGQA